MGDLRKYLVEGPALGVVEEGHTGYYQMEMTRAITALKIRIIIVHTYIPM